MRSGLARLRGVAARSATILAAELFDRGLRNRREVGALSGLVSAPYRSGTIQRDQGLVRSGCPPSVASRSNSRGRGSGINRRVRSLGGMTSALAWAAQ